MPVCEREFGIRLIEDMVTLLSQAHTMQPAWKLRRSQPQFITSAPPMQIQATAGVGNHVLTCRIWRGLVQCDQED